MNETRVFTSTRIVALAVIAAVVLGLVYLRLDRGDRTVSVPAGAQAGDLAMQACTYTTEDGAYPADCGTLVVPESDSIGSELIALPVTRIRAQTDNPAEPIFYLEGGPGITNINFKEASRYTENRDVVLVGYRGVDGSVRLDCPEVTSALKRSADALTETSFRAYEDSFRACAERLGDQGVDLSAYGLARQVDDLEAARVALGYDRINLLSQSAGTRTAMVYAWRFPDSIFRSVMIGVNPPGHFLWDGPTIEEQIDRYAGLCAADRSCSDRTDDLAASLLRTGADMPDRWYFLPIEPGNVRVASFFGFMESVAVSGQPSAPMTLDAWLAAAEGDPSGLWLESLLADLVLPDAMVWGQYAAAGRLDAQAARDYFPVGVQESGSLGYAGSAFAWGGGRLAEAWPPASQEDAYDRVQTSDVETLLIGGALDTSTPPQVATRELLPHLPNGHQVVVPGLGHSLSFFAEQPEAGNHLINTFLADGRVDDSLYVPPTIDFTPPVTLTALAKRIAGTMVGLAVLTVLSLLWMARRTRKRGRFGRIPGTLLRSLYPLPVGLGGWSLGALVMLATLPGVPLDHKLFVALAVGAPTGLGIYLAWVDRDWSSKAKATGFLAAAGGGLVGAWLGSTAVEGLPAIVAAVAGAAVGANLALIVLDISAATYQRRHAASVRVGSEPIRVRV